QLALSWHLYLTEENDRIVQSYHGGASRGGSIANTDPMAAPWVTGWLDWDAGNTDNTNILLLTDDKFAKLGKYITKNKNVFKCPADVYVSSQQQAKGWTARVRSLSGNIGVGAGNAEEGPWRPAIYKHIKKTTDFIYPGPAETWIF